MHSTQEFSITLPSELAEMVKAKVATGEYATESEVIIDGLRLMTADRSMAAWLRQLVVPAAHALMADPGTALSADEVRQRLATKRRTRKGGSKA